MIYQRVVVIYQRIFLPVRAFLKFPEHARFWGERQSTPVRPPGSTRAGERRFFRTEGRPAPEREAVPQYGYVQGVLSGRGFPLCRAQVPRQGCFSPKRGFFCAGGAVAPAFMTGKRGIFSRGCTLKAQNRHGRPFARRRDLPEAGVRGAQAPFFVQGGGIPHHRAVPRLFSSHAGRQRMFCLARMPLQGLFYGGGELRQAPGRRGMMSGPMPCAFFSLAQGRMHKRCREKAFPAGG